MTNSKKPELYSLWKHKNGIVYVVTGFLNEETKNEKYPVTITYANAATNSTWCRPLSDWHRSFNPLEE